MDALSTTPKTTAMNDNDNDNTNDDASQPTEWEKLVASVRESISRSPLQRRLQREGLLRGDVWPQPPDGTDSALAAQSKSWEAQLNELGLSVIDQEEFTPLSSVNKRRVVASTATVSYL